MPFTSLQCVLLFSRERGKLHGGLGHQSLLRLGLQGDPEALGEAAVREHLHPVEGEELGDAKHPGPQPCTSALSITPLGPAAVQWDETLLWTQGGFGSSATALFRSCWRSSAPAPAPGAAASA